jgi:beta-glucanase (GH16 family)
MNHAHRRIAIPVLAAAMVLSACAGTATETEATTTTTAPPPATTQTTAAPETTTTPPPPSTTTTTIVVPEPMPIDPPEGYELVWSDEFDGDTIDLNNWTYDIGGWGWGNGEAQFYTDRPENARVENGLLVIEGREEQYEGSYYTSARMLTQGLQEFQHGYIEARIKVPGGNGTWPAFWMLGSNFGREDLEDPSLAEWPTVGEIDIMEYTGKEPDLVLGTIHGPGYAGAGGLTTWNRLDFPVEDDFHTFAIDWDEDGIRWFFDGEQYAEKTPDSLSGREWVFDQPFFIILNVALGGTLGGFISPDLEFPVYMYVDHVRVYQEIDADQ